MSNTMSTAPLHLLTDPALRDIRKWNKWRAENPHVGVNLSYADLRNANLFDADLSYANLRYADLSYADLSYANLRSADLRYADLMTFQFQKHTAYFTFDGSLRIGCEVMSIADWSAMYEGVGQAQGYTPEQIAACGGFIKLCLEMFKARNP